MMTEKLPCLELNRHADKRLREQHPWIFSNELQDMKRLQRLAPGALVDILDCHGGYVGTGFVNPKSLIAVRLLSRERGEAIDEKFLYGKIKSALFAREMIYGAEGCYRAVFGESDGLPGLIVDRYGSIFVVEPHALGMDLRQKEILAALLAALDASKIACEAVVWRTDTRAASLEGMEARTEVIHGKLPEKIHAVEDGIRFSTDPLGGQKTGFFFDQRENRADFSRWVAARVRMGGKDLKVLDVYCHLGAWGLRALKAGAARAVFIDQSESALKCVAEAARGMGVFDKCEFLQGDAMELMRRQKEKSFDAVALDPPAFISSKKVAAQGLRAYAENNERAARLVANGGILSTSSCSYHCLEERFEEIVGKSARVAGRVPKILKKGSPGWDHPALAGVPETRYLKNILLALD